MKKPYLFIGLLVIAILVMAVPAMGYRAAPAAVLSTATPVPPTPAPTPGLTVGLKSGERFHDIHANRLQLKCDFCHVKQAETYHDPLAQVFNLTDRRACLSCHKEGGIQPFYGEEWGKAKVGR